MLLVLKAGPSLKEAVSMLMDVVGGVTNLERQSVALFLAPEIHSNVMFMWLVPDSIYLLCYCVLAIKELH